MPNWTSNRVYFKTKTAKEAEATIARLNGNSKDPNAVAFTFQAFIPMPEELDLTDGSQLTTGYNFLKMHPDGIAGPGEDTPSEEALELGRKAIANEQRYGARTWFDWCSEHWGTKWDACSVRIERTDETHFILHFDTAWTVPRPIAKKLKSVFGKRLIAWIYHDEGDCSIPEDVEELQEEGFDVEDMICPRWERLDFSTLSRRSRSRRVLTSF